MKVRFWGTRGSIPQARAEVLRYGGNTSCIEVRTNNGSLVVLDCGTGSFALGRALAVGDEPLTGTILFTHTHWDHIQGFPFFAPLFNPRNSWDICGPNGFNNGLRDTLSGQMQYDYFPVNLRDIGSNVRYRDLVEGEFAIDDIQIRTQYLDHPALTLGYRLEVDGCSLVYACDHEPVSRQADPTAQALSDQEAKHIEFLADADLLIHDAQFTAEEYPAKCGWGHSTHIYAAAVANAARARHLIVTHHDPLRDDDQLDETILALRDAASNRGYGGTIDGAREGRWIEVEPSPKQSRRSRAEAQLATAAPDASRPAKLLLGPMRKEVGELIRLAAMREGIDIASASDIKGIVEQARKDDVASVVLDAGVDPVLVDASVTRLGELEGAVGGVPLVVVADGDNMPEVDGENIHGWMIWPFSPQYAQTAIRAWSVRAALRWKPAVPPESEDQRLAAVRRLGLLDTEDDEQFDRITRMAAAIFDVPCALITLVDSDRQWFKSATGTEIRETPRESAFCSHTILEERALIVPDTLDHPCFADNPLVTGPPHVRFYAGQPLRPDGENAVGSLCLLNTRPRHLSEADQLLFRELADFVEAEMSKVWDKES